jgi:hypothetical protein
MQQPSRIQVGGIATSAFNAAKQTLASDARTATTGRQQAMRKQKFARCEWLFNMILKGFMSKNTRPIIVKSKMLVLK